MTALYVVSDLLLMLAFEPMVRLVFHLGRRSARAVAAGEVLLQRVDRMFLGGATGRQAGIVLAGFGMGLPFGRALAKAFGYRLVPSWLLTIAGDVGYFAVGMTSVLWFDGVFDDQRAAALAAVVVMLLAPPVVRAAHARYARRHARR
jgi:hypothetical protein